MISLLYIAFLISGMSGLIYQVIWVREFGQIFGNTVHSSALVSGIFVFGLGIGSFLAGRFIDKKNEANQNAGLKYYAIAEFLIALLGLIISISITKFESLSPLITSYVKGANGWYEISTLSLVARALIAFILVGPITMVMGSTLTFLIRFVMASKIDGAGMKVGLLFGINTLGAAVGCAITDFWAVPELGLMKTKFVAVSLNVIAGLLAICLYKRSSSPKEIVSTAVMDVPKFSNQKKWPAGLAVFISGFCAMGIEIAWFRFIHSLFSGYRISFSLALVVILIGMWIGAFLAGYISQKFRNPGGLFILTQWLFVSTTIGSFLFFINSQRVYFLDWVREGLSRGQESDLYLFSEQLLFLIPSLKIILLPAIMMGAAYPTINALIQQKRDSVGENAGLIYLWNAVGALLGSLITGFVLLPNLGMQLSITVLLCGSLVSSLPIIYFYYLKERNVRQVVWFAAFIVPVLLILFHWLSQPGDLLVANGFLQEPISDENRKVITVSEGINETAMVVSNADDTVRYLYTNGHSMSATDDLSQRYMRSFAHIPLLQIENPKTALVICFGVGNTLNAVTRHPSLERIDVVDLSANVLGLSSYFTLSNQSVLSDPRVNVYINDGRQHLRMQAEGTYDLITLEPPPLTSVGVASLFSEEFYQLAFRALKKGGFLTQWLPVAQISGKHTRQLIKAFTDVFPNTVLTNGSTLSLMLMGQKNGSNQVDWRSFQRRQEERPKVREDLKRIQLSRPVEWLGTFVASGSWLTKQFEADEALLDDRPVIEYSHLLIYSTLPKELFLLATFPNWCPDCFSNGILRTELEPLDNYLSLMQSFYWNENVLKIVPENQKYPYDVRIVDSLPPATTESLIRPIQIRGFNKMIDDFPYLSKPLGYRKFKDK
ncbi:MAG: spermine/spermidine synthase domain-containing protein [Pseudobdellovibrionaceae bacterium]